MKSKFLTVIGVISTVLSTSIAENAFAFSFENDRIAQNQLPGEMPIIFEAISGEKVSAFEGVFTVPENRANTNSRTLKLKYVRFPATGKKFKIPTIYLAGGPGGSGITTAKYNRFPLFMAMREFGDVIAFDQRGTGASNDMPTCISSKEISYDKIISDDEYNSAQQAAFKECLGFWQSKGIDIHGYNTEESVADLNDLRKHLSAEKINLWGISYGSHLSLAALKSIDQHINRVVITAIEGLDQTIKLPARSDKYFDRLQAAINTNEATKAKYPDVKALISRVLNKLEEAPLELDIPVDEKNTLPFLLQKRDLQSFTGGMAADPVRIAWMLDIYRSIDSGDTGPLMALLSRAIDPTDVNVSFRPMSVLMDVASGTDQNRRSLVLKQGENALLGLQLNNTMHLETVQPSLDLGSNFRQPPQSEVPTLVFTGTLDGRTFPESAKEATSGLSQKQAVTVINGGHNLFMLSPEVTHTIQAFMRGENVDGREIFIDLPKF
jgi:pimeloyl-ACP methyl ester carboxylesterase